MSHVPGAVRQRQPAATLDAQGYDAIGFDQFARPDDSLAVAAATGRLRRNFQGYVVDPADAIVGFGASSIGSLPQGYVQNEAHLKCWAERVAAGELPVARGVALTAEDRLRRAVIERLLGDDAVDLAGVALGLDLAVDPLVGSFDALRPLEVDGLVVRHGWTVRCTPLGRRYMHSVAACFDPALDGAHGRHSRAV